MVLIKVLVIWNEWRSEQEKEESQHLESRKGICNSSPTSTLYDPFLLQPNYANRHAIKCRLINISS